MARKKVELNTKVPGVCGRCVVITPQCRKNRGDRGAADEALRRVRESLVEVLAKRKDDATFFVTLTIDSAGRKDLHGSG